MNERKNKRIKKPVESPRNAFDAAKIIHKALSNLYGYDQERAIRWALEANGYAYPVCIQYGERTASHG